MAVFTIDVNTSKAEQGVESLASGVGSLSAQFDALQASLGAADGKLADFAALQQKNLAQHDQTAFKKQSEDDVLASIKRLQEANLRGHDADRDAAIGLKKHSDELAKAATLNGQLEAAQGSLTQGLEQMKGEYGAIAQVVMIVVDAVTAAVAAFGALLAKAVQLSQEKDALAATFGVLTGEGTEAGRALIDDLGDMAADMPFAGGQLEKWAKGLLAAGIQGDELKTSIKAIASATAIMGESGGAAAEGLIKRFAMMADTGQKVSLDRRILAQMAEAGISAKALAKALGVAPEKLGETKVAAKDLGDAMKKALIAGGEEPMRQMSRTWPAITAKLEDAWESLFDDLGPFTEPFMEALRSIASEFYDNSIAAGDAREAIKSLFSKLFKYGTDALNAIHKGFLVVQIAILKVRIALAPVTKYLDVMGGAADVLYGTLLLVAVAFGVVAVSVFFAVLPFLLLVGAIGLVVYAIMAIGGAIGDALTWLQQLQDAAVSAGVNFIMGLGNAIASGADWVVGIVKSLAARIVGGIKGALQIHSPSRVMMSIGAHTTRGLAEGIEAGAGDVEDASRGAARAAVDGASDVPRAGARAGSSGGAPVHVTIEAGAVQIMGAGGDVLALTEEALARLLELVVARAGLTPRSA